MREAGNETLFSPERKKVSVKVNGKDEGAEVRRRLSGGGYGTSYGGGKAAVANNHISSIPLTGVRLKGGSTMQSRHHSHNLLTENSVTKEVAVAEGESLNKKRTAEEGVLPQWGHGKRSRCSRFEPFKDAVSVTEFASQSAPRSEKTLHPTAAKLRGPAKLTSNKILSNGLLPRNNPINRTANGFSHTSNSMPSFSPRQNGGEAKERVAQKERAPAQPRNASADHRQLQGNDGSELATSTQVHVHCNGHMTKGLNNNKTNGPCNGHINKIINNNNNATCVSSSEPTSLAKPRVDLQTLEWPRIVIVLTRKEKEDDFLVLKGSKLPQRPKKRPKVVDKALHYCTPGNWLSDLSRGRYDVREKKSGKKKPRGLKAMESLESDSE